MTTTVSTSGRVDQTCAAAVEVARAAAEDVAGGSVGAHLGVRSDGDRVVTHSFVSLLPGYLGWQWAVTVARAPRAKLVTVDEVVLLPGDGALLPPPWLPWSERLRPGDLGVGDILPTPPDDDRLAPGYVLSDYRDEQEVAAEIGLGRVRLMSRIGREETVERWYAGDGGPQAAMAQHAPARCASCGFYLPLAGSLRAVFGVCGNEFAPRDGEVVAVDFGCGAHSEALVEPPPPEAPPTPAFDDAALEMETRELDSVEPRGEDAESLGHS